MIPIQRNEQTYYFPIIHITKQLPGKLIYRMLIDSKNYYLNKSFGMNDCRQLNNYPLLTPEYSEPKTINDVYQL